MPVMDGRASGIGKSSVGGWAPLDKHTSPGMARAAPLRQLEVTFNDALKQPLQPSPYWAAEQLIVRDISS
jgi:hypothetical protein